MNRKNYNSSFSNRFRERGTTPFQRFSGGVGSLDLSRKATMYRQNRQFYARYKQRSIFPCIEVIAIMIVMIILKRH
jgi:hypothetical protein